MASIKRETAAVAFIMIALFAILYLYMVPDVEGFASTYSGGLFRGWFTTEGFVDRIRCGVDLPSCADGLRCINGYCKKDVPPQMAAISDLPIRP